MKQTEIQKFNKEWFLFALLLGKGEKSRSIV